MFFYNRCVLKALEERNTVKESLLNGVTFRCLLGKKSLRKIMDCYFGGLFATQLKILAGTEMLEIKIFKIIDIDKQVYLFTIK